MATYYVKNGGSDSASGADDANAWAHHPWMSGWTGSTSLVAGDTVYLKRGSSWYDVITVTVTGTSGSHITIDAYDTGDKPLVHGFTTITSGWTEYNSNIDYKNITSSALPGYLIFDGVQVAMGRYPTDNWYMNTARVNDSSMTDTVHLDSGITDWTGATLVQRKNHYVIDFYTIDSHSGSTLNYTGSGSYNSSLGWGYCIVNDIKTLDTYKEWYYNTSTSNLYVYFGSETPGDHTLKLSTLDYLVSFDTSKDYIDIKNIKFEGCNKYGINISSGCDHVTIENCDFDYCNWAAVYVNSADYLTVDGCEINHSNNYGIYTIGVGTDYVTVKNCIISNTGIIIGHVGPTSNRQRGNGIGVGQGHYHLIEDNQIYESGFNGILVAGNDSVIQHNYINGFCYRMDDGGGIYYGGGSSYTGEEILNNIVLNGYNPSDSVPVGTASMTRGIYLDFNATYITVDGNIISNVDQYGIFLHGCQYITVTNNLVYDCGNACIGTSYYVTGPVHTRNITMNNNIYVAKSITDKSTRFMSLTSDFDLYGIFDYNYYIRPLAKTSPIIIWVSGVIDDEEQTLTEWQTLCETDDNSAISPVDLSSENDIHFIYNNTYGIKNYSLSASMKDSKNTSYSGIIALPAWTGLVLLGIGTVELVSNPIIRKKRLINYHASH